VKEGRLDLTNLEVFTIDPPNSRDLDDALSIEKTPDGNFRVGVHIADVTSFIKKGDYVDVEAYERATISGSLHCHHHYQQDSSTELHPIYKSFYF
jgi:exoribonuclease R